MFQETLDVRPHLLILNKMDLADLSNQQVKSLPRVFTYHQQFFKYLYIKCRLYICPADNHEEAKKKRGEECSIHKLFKTERRQHQTGNGHLHHLTVCRVLCPAVIK